MIELITKNGSINLTKPTGGGIAGEDGGYYIPFVDENGNLSWQASEPDMPPVEAVNIKGPQGNSGVYVGSGEMPEGYNVQIDINGGETDLSGFATKEYVDSAIGAIEIPEVDLTDYALKSDIPDVSAYQTAEQVSTAINEALGVIENGAY